MNRLITYFAKSLLCTAVALFAVACAGSGDDEPQTVGDDDMVTLSISTRALDADLSDAASDVEKLHSLRVVILSRESATYPWRVEHNDYQSFTGAVKLSDTRSYEVKRNTQKRIYLIANCEDYRMTAGGNLIDIKLGAMYLPGDDGLAPVDKAVFSLPADQSAVASLPMSAVYDFNITDKERTEATFYIVRAVNKVSLSVENRTANPIGVDASVAPQKRKIKLLGWRLDPIARCCYLMPRVNRHGSPTSYWVADTDRKTAVDLSGHWIDWMADEVKKKTESDIPQYQWMTDYTLPDGALPEAFDYTYADAPVIDYTDGSNTWTAPKAVYIHESRCQIAADDPLMLQQYTITLFTEELPEGEVDTPANWTKREYTGILPQLASLFRDTHVVVNVSIGRYYDITLNVEEQPYAYEVLDPKFGLDRDPNGDIEESDTPPTP